MSNLDPKHIEQIAAALRGTKFHARVKRDAQRRLETLNSSSKNDVESRMDSLANRRQDSTSGLPTLPHAIIADESGWHRTAIPRGKHRLGSFWKYDYTVHATRLVVVPKAWPYSREFTWYIDAVQRGVITPSEFFGLILTWNGGEYI